MVASTITIRPVYLDGREQTVLAGGTSMIEDNSVIHRSEDSGTVSTTERSDRVRRSWQLSWHRDSAEIANYFEVFRNSLGFLFISPIDDERVLTGMPLRNTVTGNNTGDGSTTTFQLRHQITLDYDVGAGSSSSDAYDVNYPLAGTVTAYANGTPVTISSISLTTGVVTLNAAPSGGAVMTADLSRAFPVLFTSRSISRTLLQVDRTELRSVQIEEII
jgi:uncharacterized protein (TIGR02217 family)